MTRSFPVKGNSNTGAAEALPGAEPLIKGNRRMVGMRPVYPDQPGNVGADWPKRL